jgi:hypothetical protein
MLSVWVENGREMFDTVKVEYIDGRVEEYLADGFVTVEKNVLYIPRPRPHGTLSIPLVNVRTWEKVRG